MEAQFLTSPDARSTYCSTDSFAKESDRLGRLRIVERLGLAPRRWDGAHDPIGGHLTCQGADVAVLEGALGAQGNLDCLFDVDGRTD